MLKSNLFRLAAMAVLLFAIASCAREEEVLTPTTPVAEVTESMEKKNNSNEIPAAWMDLALKVVKTTPGYSPPVASRNYGYISLALYEATVYGSSTNQSIAPQLGINPLPPAPQPNVYYKWFICANAAMAESMRKFFPTTTAANKASIDSLESYYNNKAFAQYSAVVINNSINYGKSVANSIFNWSATDVTGHEGYLKNFDPNYVPPTGPGKWIPTPPLFSAPVQPHWGNVRPFVATNPNTFMPSPLTFSLSPASNFYKQAKEVYDIKNSLTPTQTTIALYWADGGGSFTPPGHSLAIATQIIKKENADLFLAAEVYSRVGMAVADAFITCWKNKYIHNVLRPVTYIQYYIDPAFTPLIATPPFPEYASGHSTQSGAAAEVLTQMFGANYVFTDNSKVADGFAPRTFNSFYEMADEAAVSRLYGGIHYRNGNEKGLACGKKIGANIMKIDYTK